MKQAYKGPRFATKNKISSLSCSNINFEHILFHYKKSKFAKQGVKLNTLKESSKPITTLSTIQNELLNQREKVNNYLLPILDVSKCDVYTLEKTVPNTRFVVHM